MRYGIFSDIHSNLEALDAVIEAYREEQIDCYLCAGDLVGYAANPLECIEKIMALSAPTIAGNHDWASVDLFSIDYFNPYAKDAILWTKNKLDNKNTDFLKSLQLLYKNNDLTLVHGTLNRPDEFDYMTDDFVAKETFRLLEGKACFLGHTHLPGAFIHDEGGSVEYSIKNKVKIKQGNKYIINVGSVGQPRDGNPKAAYCVYDTAKEEIEIKRVDYDKEKARKKIISAGLPVSLGDRLLAGR